MIPRPGSPTAFEELVDDYDAARPHYPPALYDALPPLGDCLELGAGTGIATVGLQARSLVVTDLGPRMLARGLTKHRWPGVVCRAEALPFAEGSFDSVCGAQMWHWTAPEAVGEVARVLRPGGRLLLWWNLTPWNEAAADAPGWWDRQQARLEAGNPRYTRHYRDVDYAARLAPAFAGSEPVEVAWSRTITLDLYERWLRSKSYVQALPDVEGFVADCRADLVAAFPAGLVEEPFVTRLWSFTVSP